MNCPRCNSPASEETLREFGGVCPKCLLHFAEEKDAPAFPSLEIVEMIGQGGMGVVYKAIQKNLNRTVALKVLSPQLSSDPEFVERFTREAKALAQLNHPNIVGIYDSGIHDRVPYLVMEYVKGQSLRQLLAAKQLTASQALEFVPQICDALYYAHAKGIVHRDIKPENLLIDGTGRVKIADYGLAKIASLDQPRITKSNVAMGTPHYMAPEQIERTSEVDHRADLYSLGVVIYEMLTGELPLGRFKAPSERAAVDRRLDHVVLKSLEREPDDRYQSANEMKSQIERFDQAPSLTAPAQRLSKMAVASGIICLHGVAALTIAIILGILDRVVAAKIFAALGGALLLVSIGFAVPAIILILRSRGALRGLWIAVTSVVFPVLLLLVTIAGTIRVPGEAPTPPTPPSISGVGEWKEPYDLPQGFVYLATATQQEAAMRMGLSSDLKKAVTVIQYAHLNPGNAQLLYLRFSSAQARKQWLVSPELLEAQRLWDRSVLSGEDGIWLLNRGNLPPHSKDIDILLGGIRNAQPLRK